MTKMIMELQTIMQHRLCADLKPPATTLEMNSFGVILWPTELKKEVCTGESRSLAPELPRPRGPPAPSVLASRCTSLCLANHTLTLSLLGLGLFPLTDGTSWLLLQSCKGCCLLGFWFSSLLTPHTFPGQSDLYPHAGFGRPHTPAPLSRLCLLSLLTSASTRESDSLMNL